MEVKDSPEERKEKFGFKASAEALFFSKRFNDLMAGLSIASSCTFLMLAILKFLRIVDIPFSIHDMIVACILSGTSIYGFYQYFRSRYIWAIDNIFPDFVRDLAEYRRAGMTFTKAIFTSAKGNYGPLTSHIRRMARQISWGASVQEAMEDFARRIGTPLVKRIVSLINEASRSGGSIADVLMAAANDAREYQFLKKERKGSISSYVIVVYVCCIVFLAITILLIKEFIPKFSGGAFAGLSGIIGAGSPIEAKEMEVIYFYAVIVQSIGSGIVAGVFEDGRIESGVKHAFLLSVIAWLIYRIAVPDIFV